MAPGENGGEDMIIIACTDDNQGMLFNHLRQSQDRVQRQRMLQRTGGAKLWVDTYTAGLFSAESREQLEIDDQCLEYAADGEFCFVEKENPGTVEEKITFDHWGVVRVEGSSWSAASYDHKEIEKGKKVRVIAIEGAKLLVSGIEE